MCDKRLKLILLTGSERTEVVDAWKELQTTAQGLSDFEVVGSYSRHDDIPAGVDADFVMIVGGDGSIIRGCRQLGAQQIPILGINLGRLGFLTDLTMDVVDDAFEQLRQRNYTIVQHVMFECVHHSDHQSTQIDLAINEVSIQAGGSLKMLDIGLEIDSESVTTFSCDGLILSTPIGSTAHNLSAGGPILRQELDAVAITPICPHTLTVRPIVDSADRHYVLTVENPPDGVRVVIDGQINRPVQDGDRIEIKRSDATFKLVRLPGHSYYRTLHRKLGWRGQLDYRERRGHHS